MSTLLPASALQIPDGSYAGLAGFFRPMTGLNTGIFLLMPRHFPVKRQAWSLHCGFHSMSEF